MLPPKPLNIDPISFIKALGSAKIEKKAKERKEEKGVRSNPFERNQGLKKCFTSLQVEHEVLNKISIEGGEDFSVDLKENVKAP